MTKNDIWLDTFIRCMAAQSASVDRFSEMSHQEDEDDWILQQAAKSAKIAAIYAQTTVSAAVENDMFNNLGVFKGAK